MPDVFLEPPEVVPASFIIYSKEIKSQLLFPGPPETGLQGAG
jgi:hypothetical protein